MNEFWGKIRFGTKKKLILKLSFIFPYHNIDKSNNYTSEIYDQFLFLSPIQIWKNET
jgi:hypothetical protein